MNYFNHYWRTKMSYAVYMETKMKLAKAKIAKMLNADLRKSLLATTERCLITTYQLREERSKIKDLEMRLSGAQDRLSKAQDRLDKLQAESTKTVDFMEAVFEEKKPKRKVPEVQVLTIEEYLRKYTLLSTKAANQLQRDNAYTVACTLTPVCKKKSSRGSLVLAYNESDLHTVLAKLIK